MLLLLVLLAFAALLWVAWLATPHDPELLRFDLSLPDLPPSLEGARVFFFGDLHLGPMSYCALWLRERLKVERPDLLIITGDLVDNPSGIEPALGFFRGLPLPPLGIWFVPGNNENREIEVEPFLRALEGCHVQVLRNESRPGPGGDWCVIGVDDPARNRDDLRRALPPRPRPFSILLAHSPEIMHQARRHGIPLVFAGHTHGGQVRLPLVGALWCDTDRTGLRYQYGLYREKGTVLVLTKGLGCSKLPIRFLARPEALVIRLGKGESPSSHFASGPSASWPPHR